MYNPLFNTKMAVVVATALLLAGCAGMPAYVPPEGVETTDLTFVDGHTNSKVGFMWYNISIDGQDFERIEDVEVESPRNMRVFESQVPLNTSVRIMADYHVANYECSVTTHVNLSEPMDYHVYSAFNVEKGCNVAVMIRENDEWVVVPRIVD